MPSFETIGADRYTNAFRNFFKTGKGGVVLISGEGGSGKSEILSTIRLMPEIAQAETVYTSLDFTVKANIDKELGLLALRNELIKHYKVNFNFFDITYALLLIRTNPNRKLERELDVYANSRIINEILGVTGAIGKEFINKLYFSIERAKPTITDWWEKGGATEFNKLTNATPESIRKAFIIAWTKDLINALDGRRLVLIFDSFEHIYSDNSEKSKNSDAWVKELIELLPNAIFVLSGRELPNWETKPSNLLELKAENFTKEDVNKLADSAGIKDTNTRNTVYSAARGDKLDTCLLLQGLKALKKSEKREPKSDDIQYGSNEAKLFYTAELSPAEKDITGILSVCRYFNKEIFDYLVDEFLSGTSKITYGDYTMLQHVDTGLGVDGVYLKRPYRECIYASLNSDQKDNFHLAMFNFYMKKIDKDKGSFRSLSFYHNSLECFYHAKAALDGEGFTDWFMEFHSKYYSGDKLGLWILLHSQTTEYLKGLMGMINPFTAGSMEKLAQLYINTEEYGKAETMLRRMVNIREKLGGDDNPDTIRSRNKLASVYKAKGDYQSAIEIIKTNVEAKTKSQGEENPEMLKYMRNLAILSFKNKDYKEAANLGERSLQMHARTLGKEHSQTLNAMTELAEIYELAGDSRKAYELYYDALTIREKTLGGNHPETAKSISLLAFFFYRRGEYDEAEPLFYRALEAQKAIHGPLHPLLAAFYNNMGFIYYSKQKYAKAGEMYSEAMKIKERNFGISHPDTLTSMANLAALRFKEGNVKEAEAIFRKVMEQSIGTFGANSPEAASDMNNLACVISRKGDFDEAESLFRQALTIAESSGEENKQITVYLNNLGENLYRKDFSQEALSHLEKALKIARNDPGASHPDTKVINENLIQAVGKVGKK